MNRLTPNFDPKLKPEPFAQFINERFINFSYWAHPWAGKYNLSRGSGFNCTTIYIKHASRFPAPAFISAKSGVVLKNDHEGLIRDVSLCFVESDEEVFSLKKLPQKESIRLGFVRSGHYRLHYGLMESDQRKEASVDIIVR